MKDSRLESAMIVKALLLHIAIVAITFPLVADSAFHAEGRVLPLRVLDVVSAVDGVVKKVYFEDGADVSKGEILFELDDIQQRAQVESCKADLSGAQAEVEHAKRLYRRIRDSDVRGTTAVELDEAQSACATTESIRDKAAALLTIAEDELSKMSIRAPFNGRISYITATEGSFTATYREPLARLIQLDPVRVAFQVPIDRRREIRDANVRLLFTNDVEYAYSGKVDFECEETTIDGQHVIVGATFPNPDRDLLLGMTVNVEIK